MHIEYNFRVESIRKLGVESSFGVEYVGILGVESSLKGTTMVLRLELHAIVGAIEMTDLKTGVGRAISISTARKTILAIRVISQNWFELEFL